MPSYRSERAYDRPVVVPPLPISRKRSSSQRERDSSLPRIEAIEDEGDISADDSSSDNDDDLETTDCETEDEASTAPSVQRPPSSQADCSDASSPRYTTPVLENQYPQPAPPLPYQRRMTIVGNHSFTFVSMNIPRNTREISRRSSAPNMQTRYASSNREPTTPAPPPEPPNPPLKLYPWMTRKEATPPIKEMIQCQYPSNNCIEILPKNMVTWRRHLTRKHGLVKDAILQSCQWPGCGLIMGGRSLNRHVLMSHMDFRVTCPYCGVRLRTDHMQRHIVRCSSNPAV